MSQIETEPNYQPGPLRDWPRPYWCRVVGCIDEADVRNSLGWPICWTTSQKVSVTAPLPSAAAAPCTSSRVGSSPSSSSAELTVERHYQE